MLIKPFNKYVIVCKGRDQQLYRWHLKVEPWYKAWKVVNQEVQVGKKFKGYSILTIDNVTNTPYGEHFNDLELWGKSKQYNDLKPENKTEAKYEEDFDSEFWEQPISEEDFDFAVSTSDLGFAATPSYGQSYRCQICGGIVANDICTDCMFDWDC
jgi:hypothetical protein